MLLKTAYAPFFFVQIRAHEVVVASEDNARLRQQLADAMWRATRNEQAARETETLRALLEQPPPTDRQVHVARVVGWERRGGRAEVIVNRGLSGGLSRFSPAVSEAGVVGRVSEIMEDFARVRLLTDPAKYRMGKVGFSQGYTYFTWRNTSQELTSYVKELCQPEISAIFRPNFWLMIVIVIMVVVRPF